MSIGYGMRPHNDEARSREARYNLRWKRTQAQARRAAGVCVVCGDRPADLPRQRCRPVSRQTESAL